MQAKGRARGVPQPASHSHEHCSCCGHSQGEPRVKALGQPHCHTSARDQNFGHGRTNCCIARSRGAEPKVLICSTSLLSGSSECWSSSFGEELLAVLTGVGRKCSSWALLWQLYVSSRLPKQWLSCLQAIIQLVCSKPDSLTDIGHPLFQAKDGHAQEEVLEIGCLLASSGSW